MKTRDKWAEMVTGSKRAIEDFNGFADDKAIVYAADQIKELKSALEKASNEKSPEGGCECLCPMIEEGWCQKENASCYMVKEHSSQKQTIEKVIEMAIPSLDPDSYTALLDIMHRLATTRKIDWKPS